MSSRVDTKYNHMPRIAGGLARAVDRVVKSVAVDIARDAGRAAPKSRPTHHAPKALKVSYSAEKVKQGRWLAGTPNWYAHLVEFGATQAPARPHLVPAAERYRRIFVDRLSGIESDLR